MKDIIIIAIIVIILFSASFYIYRAKKRGNKCIGCPNACSCNRKNAADSIDSPPCDHKK